MLKKEKRISQFIHPSLLTTLKYWGYVLPQRTVHYLNGLLFESDFDAQPAINAKCFSKILLSFGKWHLLLKVISDSYSQYRTFTSHFFNFLFICKHLYSSEILHLLKAIKNNSWISIWSSITPTRHHWIRIYPFPTAWSLTTALVTNSPFCFNDNRKFLQWSMLYNIRIELPAESHQTALDLAATMWPINLTPTQLQPSSLPRSLHH